MEESAGLRKQLLNTRIVAGALLVFCLMCIVYGRIKSVEAEASIKLVFEQRKLADEMKAEAELARRIAEQKDECLSALEACNQKTSR